ncbi:MAG: hypothetical protein E4G90_04880 [Gemmatimonadales bacterium]|nr:MAG: hypothetical protein E4G90_04880 [Gemmatimonadales bacterium]
MSLVQLDPRAAHRAVLPTAGHYGEGKGGFDVVLARFECPASERLPAYDKEGDRGPYAYFGFECRSSEVGVIFYDHWEEIGANTGSKAPQWHANLGVDFDEQGRFDPDSVPGTKCMNEVADPRESNGKLYNGRLRDVIGI